MPEFLRTGEVDVPPRRSLGLVAKLLECIGLQEPRGIILRLCEHQVLIPVQRFPVWCDRLEGRLRSARIPVTLGSAKLFAGPEQLLRFTGEGVCFAINVPRTRAAEGFLRFLDDLALEVGARPNIVKDSRLSRHVVEATYPEYDRFRVARRELDPQATYRSELSERLGL